MPSYSTSNQNTRVFAPYVVLSQDTSRLAIEIKTTDGLPTSGITLGDVIRYDVPTGGYTLSIASADEKAEVVGVIESLGSGTCTVVVSGSVKYPANRLAGITAGGNGGIDVLFLDDKVAGGLTGTIDLTAGGEKIVKPVIQIAPHGIYNGIVVNYIGYKVGNQAAVVEKSSLLGPGSVMYGPEGSAPGSNWSQISEDLTLSVSGYPDLYDLYSSTADFIEKIVITPTSGSPSITTTYPAEGVQVYQVSGGSRINTGTVVSRDTSPAAVYVRKSAGTSLMDTAKSVYINGFLYTVVSRSVDQFVVPAVSSSGAPTQDGQTFVPYMKLYESATVNVPDALTIASLTVSGNLAVGSITNLSSTIADIQNKLTLLNNKVSAY